MILYPTVGAEDPEDAGMTADVPGDHAAAREDRVGAGAAPQVPQGSAQEAQGEGGGEGDLPAEIQHHPGHARQRLVTDVICKMNF